MMVSTPSPGSMRRGWNELQAGDVGEVGNLFSRGLGRDHRRVGVCRTEETERLVTGTLFVLTFRAPR